MNKFRSPLLLVMLFLFAGTFTYGQKKDEVFGQPLRSRNPENGIIRCVSTEYEEYLEQKDPKRLKEAEFEQWMAKKIQERKANRTNGTSSTNSVITIPVVVHVIHNGDAVGTDENISDAQVMSQITVLNEDYRRMAGTPGYNDNPVGADVEIQFCLAQIDPDGNPTNGIDRINLGYASWNNENDIEGILKPYTQWNPDNYFNIWVCKFGGSMSDKLGYAQFPSASGLSGLNYSGGEAETDGVVIGYAYFGSADIYPQGNYSYPYNKGRTATHEIGHCLGLRHIWGDVGSRPSNVDCSGTDYCDDTPNAGWENYSCVTSDSCPNDPGNDMIENYMDYTNDACMNIFTQDQKDRMLTVMQNSPRRASLLNSNVCQTDSASVEDFELLNGLALYPNPTSGVLNITMEGNELPDSYTIYNALGQVMTNVRVSNAANLTINTSGYSSGIYFIKIDKGTQSKKLKFIKN